VASAYIPVELRRLVRSDAQARCGYCHTPEAYIGMPLEYEHLYPVALGGPTERANLWLACSRCNDFKGDRISGRDPETGEQLPLFNPRSQSWFEHFAWSTVGTHILGLTPLGRATVDALQLNNDFIVITRQFWVAAGWWPPAEDY
jgi:hypothetical protein